MIKLKPGQVVLDENGEEIEIEKGDCLKEGIHPTLGDVYFSALDGKDIDMAELRYGKGGQFVSILSKPRFFYSKKGVEILGGGGMIKIPKNEFSWQDVDYDDFSFKIPIGATGIVCNIVSYAFKDIKDNL